MPNFKRGDLCRLTREHKTFPFGEDKNSISDSGSLITLTAGTIVEVIEHETAKYFAPFVWSPSHQKYFYINSISLKHINK